ncbi:MAG: diguanylate cyclase [Desulfamplus sp.]|nr:diguanylate cyclase [Desulfamplus sp.]
MIKANLLSSPVSTYKGLQMAWNLSRLQISSLILAGYMLVVINVLGMSWFMNRGMEQLEEITNDLYIHPFAVSNAAQEMKSTLFQLRSLMLQIVMLRDKNDNYQEMLIEAESLGQKLHSNLSVIKKQFLGDMGKVKELEENFGHWDTIRAEILVANEKGDIKTAESLVRTVGTPHFFHIVPLVDYVLTFAHSKAKSFAEQAQLQSEEMIAYTRWFSGITVIFILLTAILIWLRVRFLQNELQRRATVDYLTGAMNRSHFMELAEIEISRKRRYGTLLALAIADLDLFKNINDRYGHQAGDIVLKKFCAICKQELRASDVIGRIGGEEFLILLPNTGLEEAKKALERIKKAVENTEVKLPNSPPINFTASFGLAVCSNNEDCKGIDSLMSRADKALYKAKNEGRNRVSVH